MRALDLMAHLQPIRFERLGRAELLRLTRVAAVEAFGRGFLERELAAGSRDVLQECASAPATGARHATSLRLRV